jgi:hypothetical protein
MESLTNLSGDELRVLRAFYQHRLEEAHFMLVAIDRFLRGTPPHPNGAIASVNEENLTGVVHSKWNMFILDLLKKKNAPVTYPELEEAAMKKFKMTAAKKNVLRTSLAISLTNLRKKYKVLKDFRVPGSRNKFFGLSNWFIGDEILPAFAPKTSGGKSITKAGAGKKKRK